MRLDTGRSIGVSRLEASVMNTAAAAAAAAAARSIMGIDQAMVDHTTSTSANIRFLNISEGIELNLAVLTSLTNKQTNKQINAIASVISSPPQVKTCLFRVFSHFNRNVYSLLSTAKNMYV